MASTNKTTHYDLSQYVSSDKPTYLVDYNGDMNKIDTAINTAKTTADTASTAATNAQTAAESAATTANTAVTNAATADTKATTANNNIGTMANLETTEKSTLVGAINEVNTKANTSEVIDSLSGNETSKAPSVRIVKEKLVGTVLFENAQGSLATNITLSQNISNFDRLEIIAGYDPSHAVTEIDVATLKHSGVECNACIHSPWYSGNDAAGDIYAWYMLNGTLMQYIKSFRKFKYINQSEVVDTTANVYVYKVIGYKN